jgi:polysaccharide biosynthesis protein PslH
MRLLFVKEALAWPRVSGHHVHTYYLLRALARLGHNIGLLTNVDLDARAIDGIDLERQFHFAEIFSAVDLAERPLTLRQKFFHQRWEIDKRFSSAVRWAAEEFHADAVVVVGWRELAYLDMLEKCVRIWYAADDPVRYALLQARQSGFFRNLRLAVSYALFERSFGSRVDRAWVVTEAEQTALRRFGGMHADIIANGVDADYYQPAPEPTLPHSCVFWGRLDFAPNVQALEWFCENVWPLVRGDVSDGRFAIYGFKPTSKVLALAGRDGIEIIADLPDLRAEIARHQVVVLPFLSGGGIKNKLLEAASMAKAIVGSQAAASGLQFEQSAPLRIARTPSEWKQTICTLWSSADQCRLLGQAARTWVINHHDWQAAAGQAAASIESARRSKKTSASS